MVAACGGSGDDPAAARPTPCPSITPGPVDRSLIPKDLPVELFGEIAGVQVKDGFLTLDATTTTQIIELDPMIQRDLIANGYQIVSHDNEGFEAEIFFARGADTTGVISLQDNPCRKGVVGLKLVYGAKRFGKR
jgi:hypothetical protein